MSFWNPCRCRRLIRATIFGLAFGASFWLAAIYCPAQVRSLEDFPKIYDPARAVVLINKEGVQLSRFEGFMSPVAAALSVRPAKEVAGYGPAASPYWSWAWLDEIRAGLYATREDTVTLKAALAEREKEIAALRARLVSIQKLSTLNAQLETP